MPVQIRISVNDELVETLHVARLTKLGSVEGSVNEYAVVQQHDEPTNEEWDNAPRFYHAYGDDVVTLALEAIATHQQHVIQESNPNLIDWGDEEPTAFDAISAMVREEAFSPGTSKASLDISSLRVKSRTAEARNSGRVCNYKSSRMKGSCYLPYGHKHGHQSRSFD